VALGHERDEHEVRRLISLRFVACCLDVVDHPGCLDPMLWLEGSVLKKAN
jgi:hypothetical protein